MRRHHMLSCSLGLVLCLGILALGIAGWSIPVSAQACACPDHTGHGLTPEGTGLTQHERNVIARIKTYRDELAVRLGTNLSKRTTAAERKAYAKKLWSELRGERKLAEELGTKTADGKNPKVDLIEKAIEDVLALHALYHLPKDATGKGSWWDEQKKLAIAQASTTTGKAKKQTVPQIGTDIAAPTKPVTGDLHRDGKIPRRNYTGAELNQLLQRARAEHGGKAPDVTLDFSYFSPLEDRLLTVLVRVSPQYAQVLVNTLLDLSYGERFALVKRISRELSDRLKLLKKADIRRPGLTDALNALFVLGNLYANDGEPPWYFEGLHELSKTVKVNKKPDLIPGFDATETKILRELAEKNLYQASKLINRLERLKTTRQRARDIKGLSKKLFRQAALTLPKDVRSTLQQENFDADRWIQNGLGVGLVSAMDAAIDLEEYYEKKLAAANKAAAKNKAALPANKKIRENSSSTTGEKKKKSSAATRKKTTKAKTRKQRTKKRTSRTKPAGKKRTARRKRSGASCFTAETLIQMADGSQKSISLIEIGDRVRGQDGAANRVVDIERPRLGSRMLHSFNGGAGFVTSEHPFMTATGWKSIDPAATLAENPQLRVGVLQPGDRVLALAGEPRRHLVHEAALLPDSHPQQLPGADTTKRIRIDSIKGVAGDPELTVYNLLLDGNHTYFANGYLVHNKQ